MFNAIRSRAARWNVKSWHTNLACAVLGVGTAVATHGYHGGVFPMTPYAVLEEVGGRGMPQYKKVLRAPFSKDTLKLFAEETRAELREMRSAAGKTEHEFKATVWPSAVSYFMQCFLGIDTRTLVFVLYRCPKDGILVLSTSGVTRIVDAINHKQ